MQKIKYKSSNLSNQDYSGLKDDNSPNYNNSPNTKNQNSNPSLSRNKQMVTTFRVVVVVLAVCFIGLYFQPQQAQAMNSQPSPLQNKKAEQKTEVTKQEKQLKKKQIMNSFFSLLPVTDEKKQEQDEDPVLKYQQMLQKYEHGKQIVEHYMSKQLIQQVKATRYYDIHYFLQDIHTKDWSQVVQKAKPSTQADMNEQRPLLKITHSPEQLELIIHQMMYPPDRPAKMPDWEVYRTKTTAQIDLTYYNYLLSINPDRKDYLETEYYRFDKIYNIGKYGKQLPLCIVLVGKNDARVIEQSYDSIRRQNYTNYRVIHVDDNSNDGTIERALDYFRDKPEMKEKVTIVTQKYQKNALFNRNYGAVDFCKDGDIVVDMDADDWLIGNQVFQMVNSLYQAGHIYKGKRQQLWLAYTTNIGYIKDCCPHVVLVGQIPDQILQKQLYRSEGHWRTTQLRTYLWKLYAKVDKNDMVDKLMLKKGEFFVQAYDAYMNYGMVEMAGAQHMRILDQFVYFYSGSPSKASFVQAYYCQLVVQTMTSYQRIQTLQDPPKRNSSFVPKPEKIKQLAQKSKLVQQKLTALRKKILDMYNRDQKRMIIVQKRLVKRKMYEDKILGDLQYLGINISRLHFSNIKPGFNYWEYGLQDTIQAGSQYDYVGLSEAVNYTMLEKRLFKSLAHEILQFKLNSSVESPREMINLPIASKMQGLLTNLSSKPAAYTKNLLEFNLATKLIIAPSDPETLQLEYYYMNKKYHIGENTNEQQICIFAQGYKMHERGGYQKFFQSLQRMNYTNFRILYVDDYSPKQQVYGIYQWLKGKQMRVKNRLKIIRNLQRIYSLANMHIWVKTYCNQDDIVLIVNPEDSLIGTQALQVLNSVYKSPNKWFIYSNTLSNSEKYDQFYVISNPFMITSINREFRKPQIWSHTQMRSFRKKVLDSIPLDHLIQFVRNNETGMAYPRYHMSAAQNFQVLSILQLSSSERTHFLTDYFYLDTPTIASACEQTFERYQKLKARLKIPLQRLNQLGEKSKLIEYSQVYETTQEIMKNLRQQKLSFDKCKQELGFAKAKSH